MNSITKKNLIGTLLVYFMGFAFFVVLSVIQIPRGQILSTYYFSWVINNSVSAFIRYLIPIQCTSVLFIYSLVISGEDVSGLQTGGAPFYKLINSAIVMFLVLTAVFTVLSSFLYPALERKLASINYNSQVTLEYFEQAEEAVNAGKYAEAVIYLENLLAVDPDHPSAGEMLDEVRVEYQRRQASADTDTEEEEGVILPEEGFELAELIERARYFFEKEDYFSAHYYASLALELNPKHQEIRRLLGESWDRMTQMELSESQKQERAFQARKLKAYTALQEGRPIDAYFIFKELEKQRPLDPEVQEYLPKAREKVQQVSFFLDEIKHHLTLPGKRDIVFINAFTSEYRELIALDKMLDVPGNTFFQGIRVIRFDPSGSVLFKLYAPYGKFIYKEGGAGAEDEVAGGSKMRQAVINMRCIDRETEGLEYGPEYIEGSREDELRYILPLNLSPAMLERFDSIPNNLDQAGISELYGLKDVMAEHGFNSRPLLQEISMRILLPFTFILLSFFFMGFAWKYRSRYFSRPPLLSFILFPVLPFIIFFLYQFYIYAYKILFGFLILYAGFGICILVLIVSQLIRLIFTLLYLSGQIVGE
jgi:tetratricopeptide (TPR) repeat protein